MSNSRCTGHCCKKFALEHRYSDIQGDYQTWLTDPQKAKIPQIEIIAPMLIPLATNEKHNEYIYTCKNLGENGDCQIYSTRPQFCRDFPDKKGCHFWKCTSDQSAYFELSFWKKCQRRWEWLRDLQK